MRKQRYQKDVGTLKKANKFFRRMIATASTDRKLFWLNRWREYCHLYNKGKALP